jgi:hypothetical protein
LTPQEVKAHIPILDERVILGGYYVPTDADVRGWYCAAALAEKALATGGAEFVGNVTVETIDVQNGRARSVITDRGVVACDHVLLCTNVWASVLADRVGLRFPIMGVEHQLVYTEPLAELAADKARFVTHPILRHQDYSLYYRQFYDAYGIGNYRHASMLFHGDYVGAKAERAFTAEHFTVAQAASEELLPPLKGKRFTRAFNGYMAFANDLYPIIGESAIPGIWAALGVWVTHSGGVGKAIAELMTYGESEWDLREADINRFQPHDYTKSFMAARIDRQYQEVYDIIHPLQQMEKPRNIRLAPYHARLTAQEGVFFSSAGWEVAQWYAANAPLLEEFGDRIPPRRGWEARYWSRIQGAEHLATRARAGLFNLSAFTKIEVSGPGSLAFLQSITANRPGQAGGQGGLHRALQQPRGHHGRPHRDPAGRGSLLGAHRRRRGAARPGVDSPPSARGRRGAGARHQRAVRHRGLVGAAGARGAGAGRGGRCEQRGLPLLHGAAAAHRDDPGAGAAHLLRRRAGLGDLRAGGVRPAPVGRAVGGRAGPTASSRRAAAPSTRCGWRRATGCGARTFTASTTPTRRGWAGRCASTRATSWAARRSCGRRRT